jgi:[ribosomal protein S18]-alanine N-acetyltransferase
MVLPTMSPAATVSASQQTQVSLASHVSLTQRLLTLSDLDALMAIEVRAYSHPWTRGNFIDSLASGYWMQGLWDGDGQLRAYIVAAPGVDEVHLLNVTVCPGCEGRGWARRLLAALCDWARSQACGQIWLEVRASNARARRLYERFGFRAMGVRKGYYPAVQGREDAHVMCLDVAALPEATAFDSDIGSPRP